MRKQHLAFATLVFTPVVLVAQPVTKDGATSATTSAAITPADLRTRLYIFADDSMMGREAGTIYNVKATDYIAREVRRLGLVPGGDDSTYFQSVPLVKQSEEAGAGPAPFPIIPARNVIAILPGSDPALKNEYVAIGAHNDHVGYNRQPVDHDSMRAVLTVAKPMGADSPDRRLTKAEQARVRELTDSLHRAHGGARPDSVFNGADDDGSGSMAVLEIAEFLAAQPVKPKRSILFVWHTGEELGLYGSMYFTDHPTVPRDSIVAQLNMDMIGRGSRADVPNGGPQYLQLIGSRRLSTELGNVVEAVNRDTNAGFTFDYQFDANGHPEQYYCRSDHYEYARYGIPITFFSTGGHRDYHQITDEPQYIDYEHYARVVTLVKDIAVRVADLDHRVVVDHKKPDPKAECRQ